MARHDAGGEECCDAIDEALVLHVNEQVIAPQEVCANYGLGGIHNDKTPNESRQSLRLRLSITQPWVAITVLLAANNS